MNETVVTLNGVIDSYGWFRYQVEAFLNKNKDVPVRIKLDSYGGSVEEALAISRLLEEHGNVTVEFMGYVASAATWMAFGAKHIEMHEDTLWLCHKCSVSISEWGYKKAEELDQLIKDLKAQKKSAEVIDLTIARKYLERCKASGKTLQDVLTLMDEERYITSSDCLSWGFVDKVIPGMNQSNRETISNFVNLMHLPAIPKEDTPENSGKANQEGLLNRFLSAFASIFNDKEPDEKPEPSEEPEHTTQTQNKMREDFKLVNALLRVTGLPVSDEKIVLTQEQVKAIEDALAEGKEVDGLLDSISDHVKSIKGTVNKVNALKLLVDRIPTGMPGSSSQADTGDNDDTPDTEGMNDPVNEYVRTNFKKKNKN